MLTCRTVSRTKEVLLPPSARAARLRAWAPPAALALAAAALYVPPSVLTGARVLYGMDFLQLHEFRLEFARSALLGAGHALPSWYPREFLGTPFWADLQNFPWIPTRLPLLLLPASSAFAPAVAAAAALAALFTFLLARRLGLSRLPAVAAGFTFSAAGYFASRVMAGHLTLLEGYPALPLLLWLSERLATAEADDERRNVLVLAAAAACVVCAGHPQLPAYALAVCLAFLAWRLRGPARRRAVAAVLLGASATLFVWWPMLQLIRRSTRVLPLAMARSDVALPFSRLLALFDPWRDGWPAAVLRPTEHPFNGGPTDATFWDTANYLGLLPWAAAAALLVAFAVRRRRPDSAWLFLGLAGTVTFLLTLPTAQDVFRLVPGTFLRSPARLFYVPVLVLSLTFGLFLERVLGSRRLGPAPVRLALAALLLGLQAADLSRHARAFVRTTSRTREPRERIEAILAERTGSARVAIDFNLPIQMNRRLDDVGFFGSLQLATTYRSVHAMAGAPRDVNVQDLTGAWKLSAAALANTATRFVVTLRDRPDLNLVLEEDSVKLFEVPDPAPRAQVFEEAAVRYFDDADMLDRLREPGRGLTERTMLPLQALAGRAVEARPGDPGRRPAGYNRPSFDSILVDAVAPSPSVVRVVESWDPGWSVTVDGTKAEVLRADGFLLAARVPAGSHRLRFSYTTPGRWTGRLFSLGALAGLFFLSRRMPRPGRPG